MGVNIQEVPVDQAGQVLAEAIVNLMKATNMPNGLNAVGYELADIPKLVHGTLPQHRVTKLSPRLAEEKVLTQLFEDSMVCW